MVRLSSNWGRLRTSVLNLAYRTAALRSYHEVEPPLRMVGAGSRKGQKIM